MKLHALILTSALCLTLTACTSDEGMLKKQAIEVGTAKFNEIIQKEGEESLGNSEWLRQAYGEFIHNRSEVEVEEVKFQGEKLATVSVVVTTYPTKLRRTLLGIASKVDASKSRRFNFSEAVSLVAQQTGQKSEPEKQPLTVLKFSKSSDKWILDNP
ncbi:hypothetical protein [Bdellovibrio bacteriovorus]|uniref:hypothetical protein n=1 Tax=Bdellovibrio TaxID=958 RepID=UPI0035A9089F